MVGSPARSPVRERSADPAHGEAEVPPAAGTSANLFRAGARGAAWLGLAQVVSKATVLLTTVVLARILAPEEFGLVALSLVLIVYAEAVADAGVAQALVYLPRSRAASRAALVCSLVAGAALTALVVAGAPLIASFFGRPDMTPLVRLLAVSLLATSLAAVPEALLRRDLLFSRVSAATVLRTLVMGSCSVALAVAGHGAWALAWGTVAGSLAYTASLWLMARDRPDLALWRTSREDLRGVLGFGVPAAGSSLLARLIFDIDYLIVGRLVGAVAVGYYTLAFRIPELLIVNVFFVLSGVTFPLYSRMKDDAVRLGRSYLFSVRLFSLYGVCAGVGLAVAAPVVVPVVFGEKWSDAVVPLVALALYAACRAVGVGANDVFKALGRPGLSVRLSLIRLVVLTPVLVAGAHWWGMVGVAWAQLGTSLLFTLLLQGVAIRVLGLTWRDLGSAVAPALLAGSAVAVAGFAVAQLPLVPVASLVAVVAAGTAAAAAVLLVGYPSLLREVRGRLRTPSAA